MTSAKKKKRKLIPKEMLRRLVGPKQRWIVCTPSARVSRGLERSFCFVFFLLHSTTHTQHNKGHTVEIDWGITGNMASLPTMICIRYNSTSTTTTDDSVVERKQNKTRRPSSMNTEYNSRTTTTTTATMGDGGVERKQNKVRTIDRSNTTAYKGEKRDTTTTNTSATTTTTTNNTNSIGKEDSAMWQLLRAGKWEEARLKFEELQKSPTG